MAAPHPPVVFAQLGGRISPSLTLFARLSYTLRLTTRLPGQKKNLSRSPLESCAIAGTAAKSAPNETAAIAFCIQREVFLFEAFPGIFVALRHELADPDLVPSTVARAMGLKLANGEIFSEDVARAIIFLADPINEWITGTELVVDGGISNC